MTDRDWTGADEVFDFGLRECPMCHHYHGNSGVWCVLCCRAVEWKKHFHRAIEADRFFGVPKQDGEA